VDSLTPSGVDGFDVGRRIACGCPRTVFSINDVNEDPTSLLSRRGILRYPVVVTLKKDSVGHRRRCVSCVNDLRSLDQECSPNMHSLALYTRLIVKPSETLTGRF